MEKKIASIVILVAKGADVNRLNSVLSDYSLVVLGRQGINIIHRQISIISLIVEADNDVIGALSGKIGRLKNIKVKTALLKLYNPDD